MAQGPQIVGAGATVANRPQTNTNTAVERGPNEGGTPDTASRVTRSQETDNEVKTTVGKLTGLGVSEELAKSVAGELSPDTKQNINSLTDPSVIDANPEIKTSIDQLNEIFKKDPKAAIEILTDSLENAIKAGPKEFTENLVKDIKEKIEDYKEEKKEKEEKKKSKEEEKERERLEQLQREQLRQRELNRQQNKKLKEDFTAKYRGKVGSEGQTLENALETQSELLTQEEFQTFTKQLSRLIERGDQAVTADTLSVLADPNKFDQGDQSTCVACTMANVAIRSGRADKLLELLNKQLDDPNSTLNEKGYREKVLSAKSDMKGGILAAALMEVASDNMFSSDGRTGLANGQTTYGLTDSQIAKLYNEVFGEKGLVVPRAELGATDAEFANNLSNLLKENNGAVFAKLVWGEGGNQHSLHAITITKVEDGIVHFENSQGEEFSQQMSVTEFRARLQFTISENATGFEDKAVKITELKDNTIPVTMNGQVLSIEDGDISYKLSKDPKKDEEEREEALRGIFSEESIKAFKEIWEKSKKDEDTPVESMIITDDGTKKVTDDTPKEQGDDKETSSKKKGLFG